MGIVTISREYGSGGREVGQKLAEALGYLYLDKELVAMVASEAQVPLSEVEQYDEQVESGITRALGKLLAPGYVGGFDGGWWHYGPSPVPLGDEDADAGTWDEDTCVHLTQDAMLRVGLQENVVLIGRGGQQLFASWPSALHVRVVAPEEDRVRTVAAREGLTLEEAERRTRRVDDQRRRYIKRHYGVEWGTPELYHVVVNTGRIAAPEAARLLAETAVLLPEPQGETADLVEA